MVAGALAHLGKLGDGSARRDIVAAPVTVIEALARGLAEAIIVIVQVDGLERLAVFSFAHVPAITDALRLTHELVQLGIAPAGRLEAPILIFERSARATSLRTGLGKPHSKIVMLRANNFMAFRSPSEAHDGATNQSRRRLRN